MATKSPVTSRPEVSPVTVSRRLKPLTLVSPTMSATTEFHLNSILGLANARSCMILDARNSIPAVDHRDLRREAGEEDGLFQGRVATSGDGDVLVAEEEPVARGAGGDAVAEQSFLVRAPEHQRACSGRDDQRVGEHGRLVGFGVADPHFERPRGQLQPAHLGGAQLGLESKRLRPHDAHELGSHDPVHESRVVLDVRRQHQLPAGLVAGGGGLPFDHQRRQLRPRRVEGRGQAGRTAADDDDRAPLRHQVAGRASRRGRHPRPRR